MRRQNVRVVVGGVAVLALVACGGPDQAEEPVERALERSRVVAQAEWSYGQDTLPPEQGEPGPRIVERCRIELPADSAGGTGAAMRDVACGLVFVGLEPDADSAWAARLVDALDAELVDRGEIPAWTTSLGEPVRYVLVRVETGREGPTLQRARSSEGVRFVDVREVARRRP